MDYSGTVTAVTPGQIYSATISTDPSAWVDQLSDEVLDRLAERLAPRIEQRLLKLARTRAKR